MATQKFSIRESVKFGWNTMLENVGFFLGVMVITIVITMVHGSFKSKDGFKNTMASMTQVSSTAGSQLSLPPDLNINNMAPEKKADFEKMQKQGLVNISNSGAISAASAFTQNTQQMRASSEEDGMGKIFLRIVLNCLRILVAMGFIKVVLQFVNNEPVGFESLFNCYPLFFKYIAGSFLYAAMIIVTFVVPFILIMLMTLFVVIVPMVLSSAAVAESGNAALVTAAFDKILSFTGVSVELINSYGFILSLAMLPLMIGGLILVVRGSFYPYFILEYEAGPIDAIRNSFAITKNTSRKLLSFVGVLGLINLVGALSLGLGLLVTVPVTRLADAFVFKKLRDYNDSDPESVIDLDDIEPELEEDEVGSNELENTADSGSEFDSLDSEDFDFDDDFDFDSDFDTDLDVGNDK